MNKKNLYIAGAIVALLCVFGAVYSSGEKHEVKQLAQNNGAKARGTVDLNFLKVGGLMLDLKDFDFEATFKIVDFTLSVNIGGFNYDEAWNRDGSKKPAENIAKFNADQKRLISKLKRGDKVYIHSIKVLDPAGHTRTISPLMLKVS